VDTPSPARTTFGCGVVELHDEVLVAVAGDVDLRAVDPFRQRLADATWPGKPLFIDLTAATVIDGRGYRAIRAAASWLPGADPAVTVASSALAAATLQTIGGSLIRVRPS
jgi:anti-anti-sigma regulatory factor